MSMCPCKNCEDRHKLCHSTCEKYRTYRERLDAIAKKRRLESQLSYQPHKSKRRRSQ